MLFDICGHWVPLLGSLHPQLSARPWLEAFGFWKVQLGRSYLTVYPIESGSRLGDLDIVAVFHEGGMGLELATCAILVISLRSSTAELL